MAQAWHKRKPVRRPEHVEIWKASKYRGLRAQDDATWARVAPFASYRPTAPQREPDAGPHAKFLKLRNLFLNQEKVYPKAMDVFASKHGLLGLFHHRYSAPILPDAHQVYISPEAVIENGRLKRVDPASEGLEAIAKAINDSRPPGSPRFTEADYAIVAMPDEVYFAKKDPYRYPDDPSGRPMRLVNHKSWGEVRTDFDALFVLDPSRRAKCSVLVRRESVRSWQRQLEDFPAPPYEAEHLPILARIVNEWLIDISPKVVLGERGELARGWHYGTLLQAMYLMLMLDLSGGSRLKECESHDCQTYFRLGPQSGTKYCSERHASRASTRIGRGQEP